MSNGVTLPLTFEGFSWTNTTSPTSSEDPEPHCNNGAASSKGIFCWLGWIISDNSISSDGCSLPLHFPRQ